MSFNLDNISSKSLSKQCHLKDFGHYPHGAPPKKIRSSLMRKKCQGQKFSLLKDKVRRKVCNFVKFSSFDQDSLEFILFSREEATNWEGLTIKQVLFIFIGLNKISMSVKDFLHLVHLPGLVTSHH